MNYEKNSLNLSIVYKLESRGRVKFRIPDLKLNWNRGGGVNKFGFI